MLLDKGNDVVHLLLLRLKATLSLLRDDELVATDAPTLAVQTDVGGIAQAVTPVQVIPRVDKHVLNVQPLQKIVVCQFSVSHSLPPHSHIVYLPVHLRLEIADGHIPRRIHAGLEIWVRRPVETLAVELRGMVV